NSKDSLELYQKGFELLDKKRTVLIQEMMTLIDNAKIIEKKIEEKFAEAYGAIKQVRITMGVSELEDFIFAVNQEDDFDLNFKSVMGVEIPKVVYEKKDKIVPQYGFYKSNPSLDIAMSILNEVKYLCYELSQVETSAYKLSLEIKKTQKRANALDKIQIPRLKK